MKTMTFGDARVDAVVESVGPSAAPAEMYPVSTPEAVEAHRPWIEPAHFDAGTLMFDFLD